MALIKIRPFNIVAISILSVFFYSNLRAGEYLKFDFIFFNENKTQFKNVAKIVGTTVLYQTAEGCINQKPFTQKQFSIIESKLVPGTLLKTIESALGKGCGIDLDRFIWVATNKKILDVQFDPDHKLKSYNFKIKQMPEVNKNDI